MNISKPCVSQLKSIESRFETLGLTNLLETTIAKYNGLDEFVSDTSDEILLQANR